MFVEFIKNVSNPLLLIFLLGMGWILFRRLFKVSIIISFIIFYLSTTSFLYNLTMRVWSVPDTISFHEHYDGLIVLSGMTDLKWYQSQKSQYPDVSYFAFNGNRERIFAGVQFLKLGLADQMFFGNLSKDSFGETEVIKRFVVSQGIATERFVTFGRVDSTRGEAIAFRRFLENSDFKRILLITSEVHMRRALGSFLKQGVTVNTFSVGRYGSNVNWEEFIPSITGVSLNQKMLYEMYGWTGYYIQGDI